MRSTVDSTEPQIPKGFFNHLPHHEFPFRMKPNPDKTHPVSTSTPPPNFDDESAHLDDAVIGRAFRWSLISLVLIAAIAGGGILYANRKRPAKAAQMTSLTAPVAPA